MMYFFMEKESARNCQRKVISSCGCSQYEMLKSYLLVNYSIIGNYDGAYPCAHIGGFIRSVSLPAHRWFLTQPFEDMSLRQRWQTEQHIVTPPTKVIYINVHLYEGLLSL